LRAEIQRIVDLMVQVKSGQESISSILKDIKDQYEIPSTVARRVANTLHKNNMMEEEEKWEDFKSLVDVCG